jgi:hypothetical protein
MRSRPHRPILLIAALLGLALLAFAAPALAGGRNDVYIGEVEQPPVAGFPREGKIELYVHTQHHRDGSVTVKIPVINIFNVYLDCQNGHHISAGFNPRGDASGLAFAGINVKRRSFKQSGIWEETNPFTLTGTLPKHGSASGTLSVSENVGEIEGEFEGEREFFGHCESGLLHWSAQRK